MIALIYILFFFRKHGTKPVRRIRPTLQLGDTSVEDVNNVGLEQCLQSKQPHTADAMKRDIPCLGALSVDARTSTEFDNQCNEYFTVDGETRTDISELEDNSASEMPLDDRWNLDMHAESDEARNNIQPDFSQVGRRFKKKKRKHHRHRDSLDDRLFENEIQRELSELRRETNFLSPLHNVNTPGHRSNVFEVLEIESDSIKEEEEIPHFDNKEEVSKISNML